MLENKIHYFKKIYEFPDVHFSMGIIFFVINEKCY